MIAFLLVLLALLGVPLFVVIAMAALAGYWHAQLDLSLAVMEFSGFAEQVMLAAVPLFAFCGVLMVRSNLVERLQKVQRNVAGNLAIAGWATSLLLFVLAGTVVGACAFVVAFGVAAWLERSGAGDGDLRSEVGLVLAGLASGALVAPSLALLLFAIVAGQLAPGYGISPLNLYLAALLPAVMVLVVLGIASLQNGRKIAGPATLKASDEHSTRAGIGLELPLPFIVLAAIYSGWMNVVEAGLLASTWLIVTLVFIRGEVRVSRLPEIVVDSVVWSSAVILLLAMSAVAAGAMSDAGLPGMLQSMLPSGLAGLILVWLMVIGLLVLIGMALDTVPAIALIAPLLIPPGLAIGLHPAHLGVVALMALLAGRMLYPLQAGKIEFADRRGGERVLARPDRLFLTAYAILMLVVIAWRDVTLWWQ